MIPSFHALQLAETKGDNDGMAKQRLTIFVEDESIRDLDLITKRECRSRANVVEWLVRNYMVVWGEKEPEYKELG